MQTSYLYDIFYKQMNIVFTMVDSVKDYFYPKTEASLEDSLESGEAETELEARPRVYNLRQRSPVDYKV